MATTNQIESNSYNITNITAHAASHQPMQISHNALSGVFALNGVMAVLGIFGNVIVCLIIIRGRKMYTVANLFLMNLAVADMFVLVISYPLLIIKNTMPYSWPFGSTLCKIIPSVSDAFIGISLGCMTVISIHRYRMILHAMHSQLAFRQARLIVVFIWLISLLSISAPMYPVMDYKEIHLNARNNTNETEGFVYKLCTSEWPLDSYNRYYQIYLVTAWYFLPLLIIFYTFLRINFFLKKSMKFEWLKGSAQRNVRDHALGIKKALRMLAPVVILFTILMLPHVLFRVAAVFFINFITEHQAYIPVFSLLAGTTIVANSVVNPFIYYMMSREFRIEFRKQFWLLKTYLKLASYGKDYTVDKENGRKYVRRMQSFSVESSLKKKVEKRSITPRVRTETFSSDLSSNELPDESQSPNFDEMFSTYKSGEYKGKGNGFRKSRPLTSLPEDEHSSVFGDDALNDSCNCSESSGSDAADVFNSINKLALETNIDNDLNDNQSKQELLNKPVNYEEIFLKYSTDEGKRNGYTRSLLLTNLNDFTQTNGMDAESCNLIDSEHLINWDTLRFEDDDYSEMYINQTLWSPECRETIL